VPTGDHIGLGTVLASWRVALVLAADHDLIFATLLAKIVEHLATRFARLSFRLGFDFPSLLPGSASQSYLPLHQIEKRSGCLSNRIDVWVVGQFKVLLSLREMNCL
jgi:hypothetical protein